MDRPEGVRAVIIDGVAPPTVRLYDDLFGPHADALEAMFDQCAADEGCAAAYPDLREKTEALGDILTETPVPAARGKPEIFADFRAGIARKTRGFLAPEYNIRCVEAAVDMPFEEGLAPPCVRLDAAPARGHQPR